MNTLNHLKATLQGIANLRDSALREFKENLEKDPSHAFKWADGVMKYTARGEVADHYIRSITAWEEARDAGTLAEAQPQNEEEVLAFIRRSIERAAFTEGRFVSRSTSACSNSMDAERAATYADLAGDWDFITS